MINQMDLILILTASENVNNKTDKQTGVKIVISGQKATSPTAACA
jgi:hypothetical protein